ncbi:MAG: 8-oxoguanine deaminase [Enterobacteriaceae bacterium]
MNKITTILVKNITMLVTMDEQRREIRDGCLLIEGNRIVAVGGKELLAAPSDLTLDLRGHIVIPGLVNTHHHMYQSLTRVLPDGQNASLFEWLQTHYPVWAHLTPEMARVSTLTAMAELMLSGCTTSSDHLYIYPNGVQLDDTIDAAREMGMRFHACRGSMSVGRRKGGLPPDSVVEDEDAIMRDTQRLIETYHDSERYSMLRMVVAPCSPFSVSRELMKSSAELARHYKVSMHTHLAENENDVIYSREKFGMTPAQYAYELGWVGEDVWHAHCVQLDEEGIALFARTGTGVAHCPSSNMRLASGAAPIRRMLDAGVPVSLAVDGSASNDSGNMMGELRQALLLQRVAHGADALSAREVLEMATLGGARVLGRDDIGALAPGMAADFVAFNIYDQPGIAGGLHDPLAALIFCHPGNVAYSVINGQLVIDKGRISTVNLPSVLDLHNRLAYQLVQSAQG